MTLAKTHLVCDGRMGEDLDHEYRHVLGGDFAVERADKWGSG